MMQCKEIDNHVGKTQLTLDAIYASVQLQKETVAQFIKRDNTRTALLEAAASQGSLILDTSTPALGGAGARTGDDD
jgi:hypothetical protein